MAAGADGVSNTGSGIADCIGYVVNVGSGVGAGSITGKVDTGSAGSGVITGKGTDTGVASVFGSLMASDVAIVGSGAGAGLTAGRGSVTAGKIGGSAGSGVITGNGAAAGVESMFGSFITSTVCISCGAGTAGTSVTIGLSVAAGVDGAASIT